MMTLPDMRSRSTRPEEAARELGPFDAEAFRIRNVDYATLEPDEV